MKSKISKENKELYKAFVKLAKKSKTIKYMKVIK